MEDYTSLLRGSLEILILTVLFNKDCYGYQISQEIDSLTDEAFDIPISTLYPILYKLEESGFISVEIAIANNRARKYYHLLDSGKEYYSKLCVDYIFVHDKIRGIIDKGKE